MARPKNMISRPNVVAYCRVSTDKNDQIMSLQAQQEFFQEYAERNNLNLIHIYTDEGISGTKLRNRKAFNQMMRDAESGMFDYVYVKDISRFARNAVDFLSSIRALKAMGIQCRFVTANLTSEDGELTLGILALVAQEESSNMSKRVKFGKAKNAKQGKVPNLVYGYDKTKGELFDLSINEAEAQVVRRIFHLYVYHGLGASKIAQKLNSESTKTKRGCNWNQTSVCRILKNPIYTGKIINGKEEIEDFLTGKRKKKEEEDWDIAQRDHLTIIDLELFNKAQSLLGQRNEAFKLDSERQSNRYPFSTLIKCECCGYSFRRMYRKWVNEYIKWGCSGRNANGVNFCENHTLIDERELLEEIISYLKGLIKNKDKFLKAVIAEFKRNLADSAEAPSEDAIRQELSRLKKAKSKQTEMFEADIITMKELKERTAELNAAIEKCEYQLNQFVGATDPMGRVNSYVKKYMSSIDSALSADTLDNATLKQIIEKIMVGKDGSVKVYLKLFSDLALPPTLNELPSAKSNK